MGQLSPRVPTYGGFKVPPDRSKQSGRLGKRVAQTAVLGLLAAGTAGMVATSPAFAAGTSSKVFNCYTEWWNTAWAQKCSAPGATWAGAYDSGVACSAQADKSMRVGRTQGSTNTVSGTDCTFGASNGWITYVN
ncbi:hypothetical protein [Micromonospora craniellae]|uniref:hypothetical protein n=1 Tax=Micromonospora craniellae TaxID=2294034 RepID=UPI0011C0F7B9|nr:hypothetical protein [Micromonospora craniellae]QOC94171.1 hypothetical protein ID554_11520 [Micromonospora craniellae]